MKHILIITLIFPLAALALGESVNINTKEDKTKNLQRTIQMKIGKDMCDPKQESKLPTFN